MLKKQYYPGDQHCRVWFYLPAAVNAETSYLVADFNGWDQQADPMKKKKDGTFYTALTLDVGQSYEFRYLLDQERWENDWTADAYSPNEMGTENSIIAV